MLKKISVKNYKSLADVEIALGPLTILVGANASGKSNILDVFLMVKELVGYLKSANELMSQRGGYSAVVWGGETKRDITIGLSWDDPKAARGPFSLQYSARLGYSPEQGGTIVKGEGFKDSEGASLLRDSPDTWRYKDYSGGVSRDRSVFGSLISSHRNVSDEIGISSYLLGWAFYHFYPRDMRPPQAIRKEYRLAETGTNLSTVIHTLHSEGSPTFEEVFEVLRSFVPTVERLLSPITEQGQTYAAVKEKGVPEPIGTWGMSDGTLFSLALAVALLTPQVPTLLAIEAPDTELHPYLMENVADMLVSASKRTQVIATTHSPYLLNHLPIESLIIVEKENGQSTCKPVRDDKDLREIAEQLGAGKAWYSGHLGGVP